MSIDPKKRMPLDELQKRSEYHRLTEKQKLFVATYCAGGLETGNYDPVTATYFAYACKSREVARVMSYAIMENIRIVAVLNLHFNTEPIEDFLATIDKAISNKKLTNAQLQALRLKCDVLGFATRSIPGEHAPAGVIPHDVVLETRRVRKEKLKAEKPEKPPKPDEKSIFNDY